MAAKRKTPPFPGAAPPFGTQGKAKAKIKPMPAAKGGPPPIKPLPAQKGRALRAKKF